MYFTSRHTPKGSITLVHNGIVHGYFTVRLGIKIHYLGLLYCMKSVINYTKLLYSEHNDNTPLPRSKLDKQNLMRLENEVKTSSRERKI